MAEALAAVLAVAIMLAACGGIVGMLVLAHRVDEWITSEIGRQDADRNHRSAA